MKYETLINTLHTALSLKRGHGSETEARFVAWLASQVTVDMIDGAGNLHVVVGESRTMFTAHTDTVHHGGGVNKILKLESRWHANGDALGADDGCGIALMMHMIAAGVKGRYVFFRGEECGGIGSRWLAEEMPELLCRYDRAIAFDRAGLGDVITHQAGTRCCSDTFAEALSDAMNTEGLMYSPSSGGVYTDTAEFVALIPECTNLSVGYQHQHGDKEETDIAHLKAMADVLVLIDWEALPTERDPVVEDDFYGAMDAKWSYPSRSRIVATTLSECIYDALVDGEYDALAEHVQDVPSWVLDEITDVGRWDTVLDSVTLTRIFHGLEGGEMTERAATDMLSAMALSWVDERYSTHKNVIYDFI
jgi:Peptidase family M28